MSKIRGFSCNAPTLKITAGIAASAAVALPQPDTSVRVANIGTQVAYMHIAPTASVVAELPTGTAKTTCTPILPGEDVIFFKGSMTTFYISAITASGTTDLLVSVGEGI